MASKRFSSSPAASRPVSPAASRASSPVPSRCAVPGLVQAREENRRACREAAIVVPSRYRQPSPVAGRRGSVSPSARRLSRGGASPSGEKRRTLGLLFPGRSVKMSWEDSAVAKEKSGGSRSTKVDHQSILRTQVAISRRLSLSGAGKEPNNTEEVSTNVMQKPGNKIEPSSISEKPNHTAPKVLVHDRKWTDGSVPFDAVSYNLARLGKEALQRRNIASIAAAEALEEALANESVIRTLSMFSDLCSSSKAGNPLPTFDRFLSIYDDLMKWTATAESLASSRRRNVPNEAALNDEAKPATLWVEAALATDLEVLSLVNSTDESFMKNLAKKPSLPSLDPAQRASLSRKTFIGTPAKSEAKVANNNTWTRGHGVGDTINLAKSLSREMESWFLKFVEDALDVGSRSSFADSSEDGKEEDSGKVAAVLSHLKRVNNWLDGVGRKKPEEEDATVVLSQKIERLKRKIYGFVILRVGSAFDSSLSLSKD